MPACPATATESASCEGPDAGDGGIDAGGCFTCEQGAGIDCRCVAGLWQCIGAEVACQ
jgi:hypothetical protein